MRVLVVGSGGREHALTRALLADDQVSEVVVAPGNPGIGAEVGARTVDLPGTGEQLAQAVAEVAVSEQADLVVIGPEAALVAGAADAVRQHGIACFGPGRQGAQLEGSKAFAKQVMAKAEVPTAQFALCSSVEQVRQALRRFGAPHVVKADGLAAGKGVVVTTDEQQALDHAAQCLATPAAAVVVEEYLDGPEASLFVITDGACALPLPAAQDFKRVGDADTGPNTGGMGAYAPLPWAPDDLGQQVLDQVVHPTLAQLREQGISFQGLLYVGLALTSRGLRVVEFNARFGDPETQVVLPLLDYPLGQVLYAAATGTLAQTLAHFGSLPVRSGSAVTVVLAAPGYPSNPQTGAVITGADPLPGQPEVAVLHAGTGRDEQGRLIATGGRVLAVSATGDTLTQAQQRAYDRIEQVRLAGGHYRRDIAAAALAGSIHPCTPLGEAVGPADGSAATPASVVGEAQ